MVLRASTPASAQAVPVESSAAPAFEEPETSAAPAASAPAPAAATPSASTAVATVQGGAVAAAAGATIAKMQTPLDAAKDGFDLQMLNQIGFNTFPRIVLTNGNFMDKEKQKVLGSKIEVQLVSWHYVTLISAGEQNNKEADKLVRTSYDHVNLTEGGTVEAYLEKLKADGYNNASKKQYIYMYANLLWTEKGGPIDPEEQGMIQLSLSPQSAQQWDGHRINSKLRQSRGLTVTDKLVIGCELKTIGPNTFTIANFQAKKGN